RKKTLRGDVAGLTKTSSSDVPRGTPSRLRDFQSRSFAAQEGRAGPRCAADAPLAAVPARPAARHRRPGGAALLPAVAPSRPDWRRRSIAAAEAPAAGEVAVPWRARALAHGAAAAASAAQLPA